MQRICVYIGSGKANNTHPLQTKTYSEVLVLIMPFQIYFDELIRIKISTGYFISVLHISEQKVLVASHAGLLSAITKY